MNYHLVVGLMVLLNYRKHSSCESVPKDTPPASVRTLSIVLSRWHGGGTALILKVLTFNVSCWQQELHRHCVRACEEHDGRWQREMATMVGIEYTFPLHHISQKSINIKRLYAI